jgi:UDP-N-acetylmuramate--alanine ligase
MHIYFSGIGGTAIGPLALIAKQAGHIVSGSDKQDSNYIEYLKEHGVTDIHIGQDEQTMAAVHTRSPIDWVVYSSAVSIENPDHPELVFAKQQGIKATKRDELLNEIITGASLKLIAIAGTHGKTTTTAMMIWLFKELSLPISYSVGAKISYGDMGQFDPASEYFVYECDEFDRNFLAFHPYLSLVTGIAYDHHDIFPTEADYNAAFTEFLDQSEWKIMWGDDQKLLSTPNSNNLYALKKDDSLVEEFSVPGIVNRENAFLAATAVHELTHEPFEKLIETMNRFPGLSRRFEKIADNLYSDYAHTPEKIAGCLQHAAELSKNVVVVYEPLTNKRQHYIKDAYKDLFSEVKKLYWVPSYLTREDPDQPILTQAELIQQMSHPEIAEPSELNEQLRENIENHRQNNDLVVVISGGGGGSLDEWVRKEFANS